MVAIRAALLFASAQHYKQEDVEQLQLRMRYRCHLEKAAVTDASEEVYKMCSDLGTEGDGA